MDICADNIMLNSRQTLLLIRAQVLVTQFLGDLMALVSDNSTAHTRSSSIAIEELEDIKLSIGGDSDAYKRIIERHQKHISKIMFKFSRDRGTHEILVQDVFVEAYLGLKTYRAKAPLQNWLARIATRVGYHYWKQQSRNQRTEAFTLEQWDTIAQDAEDSRDASAAAELLHKLLGQLPPRDRLVLTIRFIEQCSVEETAQRTGWSESMVKVQTFRAKNKLKKLFHKFGVGFEL